MLQGLLNLLPALGVFAFLIFFHELGHFMACRIFGVRVEKFSIGFGPEILHFQGPETRYALSLIPLGGFVKPSGEAAEEIGDKAPEEYDFLAKAPWKRWWIAFAGIFMNFLLAWGLFCLIFAIGRPMPEAKVGRFIEGYPAEASGLAIGDKIIAVNGVVVDGWTELTDAFSKSESGAIALSVSRNGEVIQLKVTPMREEEKDVFGKTHSVPRIGIVPASSYGVKKYPLDRAFIEGSKSFVQFTGMTAKAIFYLLTGRMSLNNMMGPVGIFAVTSEAASQGLAPVLQLMAFLSISLGVFNLIPFPPLDGGLLLFITIEMVTGRAVSTRIQENMAKVGLIFLLGLMVVVFYNDLAHLSVFQKIGDLFR